MKIDSIVFDCIDAAPLARFWSAALGWSVAPYDEDELARLRDEGVNDPEDDPSVLVEPPEDSDLPTLFFTEVPEDKMVKNRVHLDLVADTAIEDDVERLRALGATLRNWAEEAGNVWAVMQDPEGNEFCVLPPEESQLEQADRSPVLVDVDAHERRRLPQAGHPLHVAAERHDEPGAGARHQAAHRADGTRSGRLQQRRVVRQRQVRLRHAHGQRAETRASPSAPGPSRACGRKSTPSAP